MRTHWHDRWGCARGPLARLAPATRLLLTAALFVTSGVAPLATGVGVALVALTTTLWLWASRPPLALLRPAIGLALALWLPLLLLALAAPATFGGTAPGHDAALFALVGTGLARSLALLLLVIGAVTNLRPSELRDGLLGLPLPRLGVAILLQIVQQTGALVAETQRIAAALALRTGSGGRAAAWRVLWSLPRVWLPRVLLRAERVGDAMELRGWSGGPLPPLRPHRLGARDAVALATAGLALATALVLRLGARS